MNLSFWGAAGMVTGSCNLLKTNDLTFLVDCGMFQGGDDSYAKNKEDFKFDVGEIDYLILTHAHIDHCGRIPMLIKQGFKGKIIATEPTIKLAELMLIDSAKIQEYDHKMGRIPEPLYTVDDVTELLPSFQSLNYQSKRELSSNISVELFDAGHILGSAIAKIDVEQNGVVKTIVFSGDLGHPGQKIVNDYQLLSEADYVVLESTYGNRIHLPREKSVQSVFDEIKRVQALNSIIIIPSFAVERSQEMLYELNNFYESRKIEDFPVYFDSPLGLSATRIYEGFESYYDEEARALIKSGDDPYDFPNLQLVRFQNQTRKISGKGRGIIIAGSGMCTGGRVLEYIKQNISNSNSTILFIGYQAENTLGRKIQENQGFVTIDRKSYNVKSKIVSISGFSAHGDQKDLLDWVANFDQSRLNKIFVNHGEKESSSELARLIDEQLGEKSQIPLIEQSFELN